MRCSAILLASLCLSALSTLSIVSASRIKSQEIEWPLPSQPSLPVEYGGAPGAAFQQQHHFQTQSTIEWPSYTDTEANQLLDNLNAHDAVYHVLWAATGGSQASSTGINTTPPPCSAPVLSLVSKTANSISLKWDYDRRKTPSFELQMASGYTPFQTIYTGSATTYTVQNLQAGMTYNFRIRLLSQPDQSCSDSLWCTVLSVSCTQSQVPPPCTGVQVYSQSPVSCFISWQQPSWGNLYSAKFQQSRSSSKLARSATDSSSTQQDSTSTDASVPKLTYKIKYTGDNGATWQYATTEQQSLNIQGLKPDSIYTFFVSAVSSTGDESTPSPPTGYTMRTLHASTLNTVNGQPGSVAAATNVPQTTTFNNTNNNSSSLLPFSGIYAIVFWCCVAFAACVLALWIGLCLRRRLAKSKQMIVQPSSVQQLQKAIENATGPQLPVSQIKKTGRSRSVSGRNSRLASETAGVEEDAAVVDNATKHAPLDLQSIVIADSGVAGPNQVSKIRINSRSSCSRHSKNSKLKRTQSMSKRQGNDEWTFQAPTREMSFSRSQSSVAGISTHTVSESSVNRRNEEAAWRYV